MRILRAARVFTGEEEFAPGEVVISGNRILRVGPAGRSSKPDLLDSRLLDSRLLDPRLLDPRLLDPRLLDLGEVTLVPGFVDAHCHGAGGVSVSDDPAGVVARHRGHGTTSLMASLVTAPLDVLHDQVAALAPRVRDGTLAGIHLEGPWLASAYKGAHAPEFLREPDPREVAALLDRAEGTVRMVTLAAERPGGLSTITLLHERGVVAALGHTGADHAAAVAAIAAGVTGATHLFNAMPPLHHRAPGPVLALLRDPRVWLEVIADGVHVSPDLVSWLFAICPDRIVLISDAMAAAGCGDGSYRLGSVPVEVHDGVARLAGTDTIAGSTLTLDSALSRTIAAGVDWRTAVRAVTAQPARYLGLEDVGVLRPGAYADLVALNAGWRVAGVWCRGLRTEADPQSWQRPANKVDI